MRIFIFLILAGFGALAPHRPAAALWGFWERQRLSIEAEEMAATAHAAKDYSREAALMIEHLRSNGRRPIRPGIVIPSTVSGAVINAPSPLDACSAGAPWAHSPELTGFRRTGQHYTGMARLIVGRADCPIKVNATLEFQISNPPEGSGVRRVLFVVSYVTHKRPVE